MELDKVRKRSLAWHPGVAGAGPPKRCKISEENESRLCVCCSQQPIPPDGESKLFTSLDCNSSVCKRFSDPPGLELEYYPRFFKHSDARAIFEQLEQELPRYLATSKNEVKIMGKVHKIPRRQAAFGDPGLSYNFSGVSVPALPWTPLLSKLKDIVCKQLGEQFNFVLVNRYKDGSDHIGEHRDDEKDLVCKSSIASLSFGQERDFIFKHRDSRGKHATRRDISPVKLNLEHGSLLVMKYPTNTYWYHSLPVRKSVHRARINLTFRVMKT